MTDQGDLDLEGEELEEEDDTLNYKTVSPKKHNDEDISKQITIIESKLQ